MELSRRGLAALMLGGAAAFSLAGRADAESDPLPSWNAGPAKDAIVRFVRATTDAASPNFVPVAKGTGAHSTISSVRAPTPARPHKRGRVR